MSGPEDMRYMICPYDPLHRVVAKRFVVHELKCRKNHTLIERKICPFNAGHVLCEPDYDDHVRKLCPDRGRYLADIQNHPINNPPPCMATCGPLPQIPPTPSPAIPEKTRR